MALDFSLLTPRERRVAFLVAAEALARVERVRDIQCFGPDFELALDSAYGKATEALVDLLGAVENSYP
ncbi:UNVERIFIED_ORG: hypothetical protein ABID57_001275 [Arthrobacter sp. UYEF1]